MFVLAEVEQLIRDDHAEALKRRAELAAEISNDMRNSNDPLSQRLAITWEHKAMALRAAAFAKADQQPTINVEA
jgi:hypothetical protein